MTVYYHFIRTTSWASNCFQSSVFSVGGEEKLFSTVTHPINFFFNYYNVFKPPFTPELRWTKTDLIRNKSRNI